MKTYRTMVLGASGSGKTFFLASMYRRLCIQNREIGFFLEASPEQQRELINKYSEIADPEMDWPPGTLRKDVSEWRFICKIQAPCHNTYSAFELVYYDYSGEILTESNQGASEPDDKVNSAIHQADALLVLIDGQKILHLLQDRPNAISRLDRDLSHILSIVQKKNEVPLHFVITKWDLLQNYGVKFTEVRRALETFDQFRNIADPRRKREIVTRLIPVSSLGSKFAQLDEDGRLHKNKNEVPHPYQVEMPMACMLLDKLQIAQSLLNSTENSTNFLLKRLGLETLVVSFRVLGILLPQVSFVPIAGAVGSLLNPVLHRQVSVLEQQQQELLNEVKNKKSAVNSVIKSHTLLMAKLENQFPESVL